MKVCKIEGCDRQGRLSRAMCKPHYKRWLRTGTTGPVEIGAQRNRAVQPRGGCTIPDCVRPHLARGYCEVHYDRWHSHGDPHRINTNWGGDGIGYVGAHVRVRKQRGRASTHLCAGCTEQAADWAYDHSDPDERVGDRGCSYSLDPQRYTPMCRSCHQLFDFAHRKTSAVS